LTPTLAFDSNTIGDIEEFIDMRYLYFSATINSGKPMINVPSFKRFTETDNQLLINFIYIDDLYIISKQIVDRYSVMFKKHFIVFGDINSNFNSLAKPSKNRLIGCDVAGEYTFIRNVIISTFLIEKEQI